MIIIVTDIEVSQVAQWWRIQLPMQETQEMQVWPLSQEDSLEEEKATTRPGGLQSTGSQRVEHDWGTEHTHNNRYVSLYLSKPIEIYNAVNYGLWVSIICQCRFIIP